MKVEKDMMAILYVIVCLVGKVCLVVWLRGCLKIVDVLLAEAKD